MAASPLKVSMKKQEAEGGGGPLLAVGVRKEKKKLERLGEIEGVKKGNAKKTIRPWTPSGGGRDVTKVNGLWFRFLP